MLKQYFNPTHQALSVPVKRDYTNLVNLSSNQLQHHRYQTLFSNFIKQLDPDIVRQYAYIEPLRQDIAAAFGLSTQTVMFTPGSDIIIYLILDLLGQQLGQMIIQSPTYMSYFDYATLKGLKVIAVNYLVRSYTDFANELTASLQNNPPSLVVLTNPNNVTGEKLSDTMLRELLTVCVQKQHVVLIDEAYVGFELFSHAAILRDYPHVIFIRTLSKSYGMAGLRCCLTYTGYKDVIHYLRKSGVEKSVSIVSLLFFNHLLTQPKMLNDIITELTQSRAILYHWLQAIDDVKYVFNSCTNFVTAQFISISVAKHFTACLKKHAIIVKHLCFEGSDTDMVRVTVADQTDMNQLKSAITDYIATGCSLDE